MVMEGKASEDDGNASEEDENLVANPGITEVSLGRGWIQWNWSHTFIGICLILRESNNQIHQFSSSLETSKLSLSNDVEHHNIRISGVNGSTGSIFSWDRSGSN